MAYGVRSVLPGLVLSLRQLQVRCLLDVLEELFGGQAGLRDDLADEHRAEFALVHRYDDLRWRTRALENQMAAALPDATKSTCFKCTNSAISFERW